MTSRNFSIGELEKKELLTFDLLYRLNAKKSMSVLLDREQEFLENSFTEALAEQLIQINSDDEYELSQSGKEKLIHFGKMFQRFKDLAIFKCVNSELPEPKNGQKDQRFGGYHDQATPPETEDFRVMVFENFFKRENRKAPLHLFVFFSLIENLNLDNQEEDWIWQLANGSIFDELKEIIDSQISAEEICPEGWTENEIVDEIYRAGMKELKRCYEEDLQKFNPEEQYQDQGNFWKEDLPHRHNQEDSRYNDYYEPYWEPQVGVGTAFCVGAFAGLATCALLS